MVVYLSNFTLLLILELQYGFAKGLKIGDVFIPWVQFIKPFLEARGFLDLNFLGFE